MVEDETPKLTKTEEKESFLTRLEEKTKEFKRVEDEIRTLVERNEELAARNLLGGKTDAGVKLEPKVETNKEYLDRILGRK